MLRFPAGVKQAARLSLLLFLCFACRSPEKERPSEPAARALPVEELDVPARTSGPPGRPSPILFEKLPLAGVAFPPSLESGVGQVVARDGRIDDEEIRGFLDPRDEKAGALSRVLAATRVTQRIARDLYDRERPDLLALYFEGTDEVGHLFAPYAPPKLACTSDADFARYGKVVDGYYALVDRLLGQWMRRAKEDGATLLVHSDHGFKWGSA